MRNLCAPKIYAIIQYMQLSVLFYYSMVRIVFFHVYAINQFYAIIQYAINQYHLYINFGY